MKYEESAENKEDDDKITINDDKYKYKEENVVKE